MKRALYAILILIFFMNSFSMLEAASMTHNTNETCLFETILGGSCDMDAGATALALHHIAGIKAITEVLPTSWISMLLILLFTQIFLFFGYFSTPRNGSSRVYLRFLVQKRLCISTLNPILKWILLHNKMGSPPILKQVVA